MLGCFGGLGGCFGLLLGGGLCGGVLGFGLFFLGGRGRIRLSRGMRGESRYGALFVDEGGVE